MASRVELLSKLTAAGLTYELVSHDATPTAESQVKELEGKLTGAVVKNLFLKDKKGRLYLISLLTTTKFDMKALAARLGVGKTGLSMAPEALMTQVLQVPLGSVTPLALLNESADSVHLLMDHNLRTQTALIMHPLVNTASVALTPTALEGALSLAGRTPVYVDLEAEPVIDKDSPPDLVAVRDSAAGPTAVAAAAAAAAAAGETAASGTPAAAAAPPTPSPASTSGGLPPAGGGKAQKAAGAGGSGASSKAAQQPAAAGPGALMNVAAKTEDILQQVASALLGGPLGTGSSAGMDPFVLRRLRADIEMQLNALRNASYSAGYVAGKGELVAAAQRRFA